LARTAVREAWSVRTLEARARASNQERERGRGKAARRARAGTRHPDQDDAAREIADALSGALGTEVHVEVTEGGYRAELNFANVEQAIELARRLRPRAVA
jgi:hypothetical protein